MHPRIARAVALAAIVGLLTAAVGAAAATVKPDSGKFSGSTHTKQGSQSGHATLTVTVVKGQITASEFLGTPTPVNTKKSHGFACGAASDFSTKGMKRSGNVSADGHFSITFRQKGKGFTDTQTVSGRFTSATTAKATWRDVSDIKVAKSHCDTGNVAFTLKHK
jgi:hypothetical protein